MSNSIFLPVTLDIRNIGITSYVDVILYITDNNYRKQHSIFHLLDNTRRLPRIQFLQYLFNPNNCINLFLLIQFIQMRDDNNQWQVEYLCKFDIAYLDIFINAWNDP
jgi:hypothetical protein